MVVYTHLAALNGQGDQMSTSTRKTVTPTVTDKKVKVSKVTAVKTSQPVKHLTRNITRYTFEYQRDRVSRQAGSSYFRVHGNDGEGVDMTLQEAQSLYNFLNKALNG